MTTVAEPEAVIRPLEDYLNVPETELCDRIAAAKERLGSDLLILGHHYQRDDVIRFADLRGDSFKLSRQAAAATDCRYIVFCGVHFMAETADILTSEKQIVILPDLGAGCSMADMADLDQVETCWEDLATLTDTGDIMPITYVNSAASLKAFCGQYGGAVCTSSNARAVLEWAWGQRSKVLFFPDQHLGRNTARDMGVPLDDMIVWNPFEPMGGNDAESIRNAKVILWKGHCSVHQMFLPEHVDLMRERFPGIRILVHPECMMEVVDKADDVGSTEYILSRVRNAEPGSKWAIGTELHLVNRLKHEHPEQEISFLCPMVCMCATMYRINVPHLAWTLENLVDGNVVNQVKVPADVAADAKLSLDRMLQVT